MAAYVAGDQEAFRELFRRYAPVVFGIVRRGVGNQDEANDLVQQTFLHMHRGRLDFHAGARLRPWLLTIALNVKREYLRRRGRDPVTPVEPDTLNESPSDRGDPERALHGARIRAAVRGLPAHQREVIELHWFSGLPFAEIAHAVGAKESAVKLRAFRAYRALRNLLGAGTNGAAATVPDDGKSTHGLQ